MNDNRPHDVGTAPQATKLQRHGRPRRRLRRGRRPRLPSPARHLRHVGAGDTEVLRPLLPKQVWFNLSLRQRRRLLSQVQLVNAWTSYSEAAGVRWGNTTRAVERFTEAARLAWGERISPRTLGRWLGVLRSNGLAGLADQRGRPRGSGPRVDSKLWSELRRLVVGGLSVKAAHANVRSEAARRGLWFPGLRTTQGRIRIERMLARLNQHLMVDCMPN